MIYKGNCSFSFDDNRRNV